MKAKRLIAILLIFVFIVTLVTACTETKDTETEPTKSVQTTTAKKEATKEPTVTEEPPNFNETGYPIVNEPITVTSVFSPYPGWAGPPEDLSLFVMLEEITNIHVEWTLLPSDQDNVVQLYLAAGDFPDYFRNYMGNDNVITYGVEGGMLYDYSDLLDQYMPNLIETFKRYPEARSAVTQIDGSIYNLPRIQKASTSASAQMFARTDYLDMVNMDVPKTVDEFYDALVAIKGAGLTEGFSPLIMYDLANYNNHGELFLFVPFGESAEIGFTDDGSGKVIYNKISEQYRLYLEYANKLYSEQLIENEMFTIDAETTMSRIKLGQAAFMDAAHNLVEDDFENGEIQIACLAPLTSSYSSTQKFPPYPYVSVQGGAINVECEYVKELLRMFDISFATEDVVTVGLYGNSESNGLEGSDWKYSNPEKSAYEFMPPADQYDPNDSIWKWVTNHVTWGQAYGLVELMATSGTGNSLVRETGMMTNNIPYAVIPFPNDYLKYTTEETDSIANKLTDIDSYVMQMRGKFLSGVEPLSNWDAYVEQVKAMGLDDVLAVKQAAYDRLG